MKVMKIMKKHLFKSFMFFMVKKIAEVCGEK